MTFLRPLMPVAALALVLLLFGHFYGRFALSSPVLALPELAWQAEGRSLEIISYDFVTRYFLLVSGLVVVTVGLALVVLAASVILRESGASLRRGLGPVMLGVPVLYAALLIFDSVSKGKNHVLTFVPRELLRSFLGSSAGVPEVLSLENFLSALVLAALGFLTLSASALLLPYSGEAVTILRRRQARLQQLLYIGAALIIAAILHFDTLLQWPVGFLAEAEGEAVRRLATGHSMANGLYWSLLLGSIYLSVAWTLRAEIYALTKSKRGDENSKERATWLEEQGLASSFAQRFGHFAAVLGPLLAGGPLATLLDLLRVG